jgi:hypothetical protein
VKAVLRFIAACLLGVSVVANPSEFSYQEWNGEAIITRYLGTNSEVVIPSTIGGLPVRRIGNWLSPNGNRVVIPEGVVEIIGYAFYQCTNIAEVTIPNTVTNIGDEAFRGTSLTNVLLPASLLSMGTNPFGACSRLREISVAPGNWNFSSADGVLFNKAQTELVKFPQGRGGEYAVPETVTFLPDEVFADCAELTNVILPSIANVPRGAFSGSAKLRSVTLPENVRSIGEYTFADCESLANFRIPNSVTNIDRLAFYRCYNLAGIELPSELKSIGDGVFASCWGLRNITIPDGATMIGPGAFMHCIGLTNANLPNSLKTIGNLAFAGCAGLTTLSIPNGITNIGSAAFASSGLVSIHVPDSITNISYGAFGQCATLRTVTLPAGLLSIEAYAFRGCSNLAAIEFPESLIEFGTEAFNGCNSLKNFVVPNKVRAVGSDLLANCTSLTNVTIGAGVWFIGYGAFASCTNLMAINVSEENAYYSSEEGVLFDKFKARLLRYPPGRPVSYYKIPENVYSLAGEAFRNSSRLRNVIVPVSVGHVEFQAFSFCENLNAIYFAGNAPRAQDPFVASPNVTLYNNGGWEPVFHGRPTMAWAITPKIGLGDHGREFGVSIASASFTTIIVEACTDLGSGVWIPVTTNSVSGESVEFRDSDLGSGALKFYRLRGE